MEGAQRSLESAGVTLAKLRAPKDAEIMEVRRPDIDTSEFPLSLADRVLSRECPFEQDNSRKSGQVHVDQEDPDGAAGQVDGQVSRGTATVAEDVACLQEEANPESPVHIFCGSSAAQSPAKLGGISSDGDCMKQMECPPLVACEGGIANENMDRDAAEHALDSDTHSESSDGKSLSQKAQASSARGTESRAWVVETTRNAWNSGKHAKRHLQACGNHSGDVDREGRGTDIRQEQKDPANWECAVEEEQVVCFTEAELADGDGGKGTEARCPLPDLCLSQFVEDPVGSQNWNLTQTAPDAVLHELIDNCGLPTSPDGKECDATAQSPDKCVVANDVDVTDAKPHECANFSAKVSSQKITGDVVGKELGPRMTGSCGAVSGGEMIAPF